ncbi:LacI family DNA-binding transcriptional regulator [uncultured Gemmiger sp.]|uniref:LacI family transcriptional regulator n=1 Tax=Subdoligranulum variabile TaxID=214851 RepID=A0A921IL52_9FIRM|nr:LacI family DNA-binding transcriptional regulator [uncultured Gemmiger sp.]HJG28611.1 LacI family transcriptional regulator [Subdoligranulum variabile]
MNIYEIAREAGVSIATVSRVVNNKGPVSAATRARVEAVLARHNYTPSAIAQSMVGKSLHTVAVLTVDIRVPHYAQTAYTIERAFRRRGYGVILCNTGGDREETLHYLKAVRQKQVDGIVLVGSVFDTICTGAPMTRLLTGLPVVLANGKLPLPNAYSVLVDDRYGIGLAVEHLAQRGRRELYYIKDRDTDSALAKRDGFLEAMARCGLPARGHVLESGQQMEDSLQAVQQLLADGVQPDGIICGEDLSAVGAVKALLRAGLQIPRQVAVVGYNHSDYARLCEPALTSIDNKPDQVALLSVQLLEGCLEQEAGQCSVTLLPELVQGETS